MSFELARMKTLILFYELRFHQIKFCFTFNFIKITFCHPHPQLVNYSFFFYCNSEADIFSLKYLTKVCFVCVAGETEWYRVQL